MRIAALSQDPYWLSALQRAVADTGMCLIVVKCQGDLQNNLSDLPTPDQDTILLVDASQQIDAERVVTSLRSLGWEYIIVLAADPNAKEAAAILRRGLSYDYWEKSYVESEILDRVNTCFEEIKGDSQLQSIKQKRETQQKFD
jgi:hypothetical protein